MKKAGYNGEHIVIITGAAPIPVDVVNRIPPDALLMAAGRHAALADLGLARAGVQTVAGHVVHDAAMRTTNPSVYASNRSIR